jgi:hypothetical protein
MEIVQASPECSCASQDYWLVGIALMSLMLLARWYLTSEVMRVLVVWAWYEVRSTRKSMKKQSDTW